jgi:hypothetical protein
MCKVECAGRNKRGRAERRGVVAMGKTAARRGDVRREFGQRAGTRAAGKPKRRGEHRNGVGERTRRGVRSARRTKSKRQERQTRSEHGPKI